MLLQRNDGTCNDAPRPMPLLPPVPQRYDAVVPAALLDAQGSLIEELISFAFDTLGVRHLEVRVIDLERAPAQCVA